MSTLKIEGFSNHKLKQAHVSAQWANLNHMQANSITGNVKNQGKKQTTTSSLQLYKIQMISKKHLLSSMPQMNSQNIIFVEISH